MAPEAKGNTLTKVTHVVDKNYINDKKGFAQDNRYNRTKNKELEELEKELENTSVIEEVDEPEKKSKEPPVNNSEDESWKKRYSDLRSYLSQKENDLNAKIQELQSKVTDLEKKPVVYPKTDEEVQEWIDSYPDVAGVIQTIVGKTSEAKAKELEGDIAELKKERQRIAFERAYNKLLSMHPDFDELNKNPDFADWLKAQPKIVRDTVISPSLDDEGVLAAARTVDLYKMDKGIGKTQKKEMDRKEAAKAVSRSSSERPKEDDGAPRFTESQVAAMNSKTFEKNMDAIIEAQRKGPPYFVYDISGKAR